ncbi:MULTISPECIES: hypothetical protein [unclassified Thioalkalivibrio]|uniref:hypothetical protein n=1 Tax=unclassified Thioalkalivibrio TaxID=2621013 RepID=UPI000371DF3A|nr:MULTISPECIES: hypothetical protein [unclassified Thioalkalivibrio]
MFDGSGGVGYPALFFVASSVVAFVFASRLFEGRAGIAHPTAYLVPLLVLGVEFSVTALSHVGIPPSLLLDMTFVPSAFYLAACVLFLSVPVLLGFVLAAAPFFSRAAHGAPS